MSKNSSFVKLVNELSHLHDCDVINTKLCVELIDLAGDLYSSGKHDKDLLFWSKRGAE